MSDKLIERCRLCFSNDNLMSMLSGKSRRIRDSLRKMIEDTVYIQIEPDDHVALVCFNCLVDVSNFYFFRLHCRENEKKLKGSESGHQKRKKMKLSVASLKDIGKPDLDLTEEALQWLLSKRVALLEHHEQPKCSAAKYSQTYQETPEAFSQCEAVATASQECQTDEVEVATIKSTKKRSKSTQTESHIINKMKRKAKNSYSQTNNTLHLTSHLFLNYIDSAISIECGSQTDIPEVAERDSQCNLISARSDDSNQNVNNNSYSQTSNNLHLTSHLFVNNIDASISTQTCSSQTDIPEMTERDSQCDLILTRSYHTNQKDIGKKGKRKTVNNYSQTDKNVYLTPHLYLNYIESSISTHDCDSQTDIPKVTERDSQCDLILTRNYHSNQKDIVKKGKRKTVNNYSQTDKNVCLTPHLFLNYIESSITTQDCDSQTDIPKVTERDSQCDLIPTISDYLNQLVPSKSKDICEITVTNSDHDAVDDALSNGFDYDFIEKNRKSEISNEASVSIQDNFSYETHVDCNKNSSRADIKTKPAKKQCSPLNKNSNKVNPELSSREQQLLPVNKISNEVSPQLNPIEKQLSPCLTVTSTPITDSWSPQSSDLLQVKGKSMCVEICSICDKILYNKRELASHNKTHMQCNICKRKFKRIKTAQIHVSTCKINKFQPSLYIDLTRESNDIASFPKNCIKSK